MTDSQLLDRITVCPDIFGGKPIIRGMRFSVQQVVGMLAAGDTAETILDEYSFLQPEDIQACLLFAYQSLSGDNVYDRVAVRRAS